MSFFFQAEDGIRDYKVTGVQTCALPIFTAIPGTTRDLLTERADIAGLSLSLIDTAGVRDTTDVVELEGVARAKAAEIGRASGRDRGESGEVDDAVDGASAESRAIRIEQK